MDPPAGQSRRRDLPLTVERHAVATFRWGPAEPVPGFGDVPGGFYARPEGNELFLLGSLTPAPQVDPGRLPHHDRPRRGGTSRRPPRREGPFAGDRRGAGRVGKPLRREPRLAAGDRRDRARHLRRRREVERAWLQARSCARSPCRRLVMGRRVDPGLEAFSPARFETGHGLDAGFGEVRILG